MMKPTINSTQFGSIKIEKSVFDHDVMINLEGQVKKRKKKLSKAIYGTSHIISQDEAEYVYETGAKLIIIGTGQYSRVTLSEEANVFFERKDCEVKLQASSEAIKTWNDTEEEKIIGLFHVTC